jgi:hypothetical protein
MVQARAHVLIGSFEPLDSAACTFLNTLKSTNGPFLLDRLIFQLPCQQSVASRRTGHWILVTGHFVKPA